MVVELYKNYLASNIQGTHKKYLDEKRLEGKEGQLETINPLIGKEKSRLNLRRGRPPITEKYLDKIPALYEAILGGFSTKEDFEKHTGLKYWQFKSLADRLELELPDFRKLKIQKDIQEINQALDYGFSRLNELSEVTGIPYQDICSYKKRGLIKLPKEKTSTKPTKRFRHGKVAEHKDLVDKMIAEGNSQFDIARKIQEISGQRIHRQLVGQYIKGTKRHEKWNRKKRLEPKIIEANEKVVEQDLVNTLYNVTIKRAEEKGYGEAIRYYVDKGNRVGQLKKLVKLVRTYKNARDKGKRLSYQRLADRSGFKSANDVIDYLKNMNFQSLCWTKNYLTPPEKNTIKKISKLGLNSTDIGYFLDRKPVTIYFNLKRLGKNSKKRGMSELRHEKGHYNLSYREASQIYGFTDEMNTTPEEIAQALNKPIEIVETALNYRKNIEPKLTMALKILFPKERINKPYR